MKLPIGLLLLASWTLQGEAHPQRRRVNEHLVRVPVHHAELKTERRHENDSEHGTLGVSGVSVNAPEYREYVADREQHDVQQAPEKAVGQTETDVPNQPKRKRSRKHHVVPPTAPPLEPVPPEPKSIGKANKAKGKDKAHDLSFSMFYPSVGSMSLIHDPKRPKSVKGPKESVGLKGEKEKADKAKADKEKTDKEAKEMADKEKGANGNKEVEGSEKGCREAKGGEVAPGEGCNATEEELQYLDENTVARTLPLVAFEYETISTAKATTEDLQELRLITSEVFDTMYDYYFEDEGEVLYDMTEVTQYESLGPRLVKFRVDIQFSLPGRVPNGDQVETFAKQGLDRAGAFYKLYINKLRATHSKVFSTTTSVRFISDENDLEAAKKKAAGSWWQRNKLKLMLPLATFLAALGVCLLYCFWCRDHSRPLTLQELERMETKARSKARRDLETGSVSDNTAMMTEYRTSVFSEEGVSRSHDCGSTVHDDASEAGKPLDRELEEVMSGLDYLEEVTLEDESEAEYVSVTDTESMVEVEVVNETAMATTSKVRLCTEGAKNTLTFDPEEAQKSKAMFDASRVKIGWSPRLFSANKSKLEIVKGREACAGLPRSKSEDTQFELFTPKVSPSDMATASLDKEKSIPLALKALKLDSPVNSNEEGKIGSEHAQLPAVGADPKTVPSAFVACASNDAGQAKIVLIQEAKQPSATFTTKQVAPITNRNVTAVSGVENSRDESSQAVATLPDQISTNKATEPVKIASPTTPSAITKTCIPMPSFGGLPVPTISPAPASQKPDDETSKPEWMTRSLSPLPSRAPKTIATVNEGLADDDSVSKLPEWMQKFRQMGLHKTDA